MSVFVGVRVPERLFTQLGENRSESIIKALEAYYTKPKRKTVTADPKPQIVKRAPSKLTEEMYRGKAKCPHDYMNWLSCPTCNPR